MQVLLALGIAGALISLALTAATLSASDAVTSGLTSFLDGELAAEMAAELEAARTLAVVGSILGLLSVAFDVWAICALDRRPQPARQLIGLMVIVDLMIGVASSITIMGDPAVAGPYVVRAVVRGALVVCLLWLPRSSRFYFGDLVANPVHAQPPVAHGALFPYAPRPASPPLRTPLASAPRRATPVPAPLASRDAAPRCPDAAPALPVVDPATAPLPVLVPRTNALMPHRRATTPGALDAPTAAGTPAL